MHGFGEVCCETEPYTVVYAGISSPVWWLWTHGNPHGPKVLTLQKWTTMPCSQEFSKFCAKDKTQVLAFCEKHFTN